MWVRDFHPNAIHKWIQGKVLVPVGALQYNVSIKGSNTRKVHVDQLLKQVAELPRGMLGGQPDVPISVPIAVPGEDISTTESSAVLVPVENSGAAPQQADSIPPVGTQGDIPTIPDPQTAEQMNTTSNINLPSVTEIPSATDSVVLAANSHNHSVQQPTRRLTRETQAPKRLIEEI